MSATADSDQRSPEVVAADAEKKKKKKRDKFRSAWISFAGRIVAQLVGAAATIVLGIMFVQKYKAPDQKVVQSAANPAPYVRHLAQHRSARATGELAVAVLPIQNFSQDPQQDRFADAVTEALTMELSQVKDLRVISRTSAMTYKGTRKALPEIAEELGADLIIEGSIAHDAGRVRVTAQLIDADTDQHLWAKSYVRSVRDVLTVQAAVAAAIARDVNAIVGPRQQTASLLF